MATIAPARAAMTLLLVLVLALTAALLVYGLLAWEHIVRRRRQALDGGG